MKDDAGIPSDTEGMIHIPGGEFLMGVEDDEVLLDGCIDDLHDAKPPVLVTLSAFLLDITPVTNHAYKQFVDQTGYPAPSDPAPWQLAGLGAFEPWPFDWDTTARTYPPGRDDYPVVNVSWYDALAYAEWMGKRLPTEAEWEKAARGTDGRPYPWGFDERANENASEVDLALRPCGAQCQDRSPYGCLDMLSGVHEWCADWYRPDAYSTGASDGSSGVRATASRVQRGCGASWPQPHLALRFNDPPWERSWMVGFRCALSVEALDCPAHGQQTLGRNERRWCRACGRPS